MTGTTGTLIPAFILEQENFKRTSQTSFFFFIFFFLLKLWAYRYMQKHSLQKSINLLFHHE